MSHPYACASFVLALSLCAPAGAQISASITVAPPPLPIYAQPMVPGEGYIWAPGYWSWSDDNNDYFWVPGTWVLAPSPGDLWTPGYWSFDSNYYLWHGGYWGPEVGFYGGLNYGYGYAGVGYAGGRWRHGVFGYNSYVSNVSVRYVQDIYNDHPHDPGRADHTSFNGGRYGSTAHATAQQRTARDHAHAEPSLQQQQHERDAQHLPTQFAHGQHVMPQVAATVRPSVFTGGATEPIHSMPPARVLTVRNSAPSARMQAPPRAEPPPVHRGAPAPAENAQARYAAPQHNQTRQRSDPPAREERPRQEGHAH